VFVTSQGSAHARFTRAIERGHLLAAETAARELGRLSLDDALTLTFLIAREKPARHERAEVRWHGRFELETPGLELAQSQLALAALAALTGPSADEAARTLVGLADLRRPASRA
jgi:hypothetical protein